MDSFRPLSTPSPGTVGPYDVQRIGSLVVDGPGVSDLASFWNTKRARSNSTRWDSSPSLRKDDYIKS